MQRQRVRLHTNRNISIPITLDRWLVEQARVEDRPVSRIVKRALLRYRAVAEAKAKGVRAT